MTDTGIYQIIALPVIVEGHSLVLELISRSDTGVWFNSQGKELLLEKYGHDFYTDSLTGSYCRQYFEDQRTHFENSDGIVMIDVDHFKQINDTYGHPIGDIALKKIASAILSCIRSSDVLIRYGGDEFLVIFPRIEKQALLLKLRYIQNAVSHAVVDRLSGYQALHQHRRRIPHHAADGSDSASRSIHVSGQSPQGHTPLTSASRLLYPPISAQERKRLKNEP